MIDSDEYRKEFRLHNLDHHDIEEKVFRLRPVRKQVKTFSALDFLGLEKVK